MPTTKFHECRISDFRRLSVCLCHMLNGQGLGPSGSASARTWSWAGSCPAVPPQGAHPRTCFTAMDSMPHHRRAQAFEAAARKAGGARRAGTRTDRTPPLCAKPLCRRCLQVSESHKLITCQEMSQTRGTEKNLSSNANSQNISASTAPLQHRVIGWPVWNDLGHTWRHHLGTGAWLMARC